MQLLTIFFCLLVLKCSVVAQGTITVSNKDSIGVPPYPNDKPSYFIHPKMDTSLLQFVAAFKATGNDSLTLPGELFLQLKKAARHHGCNLFQFTGLFRDSIKRPQITIHGYFGSASAFDMNRLNYEENEIFIFCPEKARIDTFSLKVNDTIQMFSNNTYLKYTLKEGEELRLSKGGFSGFRLKLKYKKGKPPVYLMVTGFGLGSLSPPTAGVVGVSMRTGQITEMTEDFGQFFVYTLLQKNQAAPIEQ